MTLSSALGTGWDAHRQALADERGGLSACAFPGAEGLGWDGEVAGLDTPCLPPELARFDCRNNRLAWRALQADGFLEAARAAVSRHGPRRVAVFMGTSTSGIGQTEDAFRARDGEQLPDWFDYRHTHNMYSLADFVRAATGAAGISACISTACSSSAKVFASAARAIRLGLCDAALVGGCDSLCLTTLCGFHSLQLVSPSICRPADAARDGISIGEGAGFALVDAGEQAARRVIGYGESSDAHHMSTPEPQGAGAAAAMRAALSTANLAPPDIAYVNLHGTATPANDTSESRGVAEVLGDAVPCSSTKGWTGHTLGAAGIIEAAFALMALESGQLPRSLNTENLDPEIACRVLTASEPARGRRALSNSFGFGGSNCALALEVSA